ncbi:DsbA family protein [Colwelliaceae bacterium 6441]
MVLEKRVNIPLSALDRMTHVLNHLGVTEMTQCNDEVGCLIPQQKENEKPLTKMPISNDVIFVTDPICSHCWAIEPMWRRLVLNYHLKVKYIHGGLLPGWQGFGDANNGISKPSDVIPHWQHVAQHYQQPIDPSMWHSDPISNSYILCKAAIAVRYLAPNLESAFVRHLREKIFLYAINVAKESELLICANAFNLDPKKFQFLLNSSDIDHIFTQEKQAMYGLGARGFPSIIFTGTKQQTVAGSQPYQKLEQTLMNCFGEAIVPRNLTEEEKLLSFPSWTLREATEVLQCHDEYARKQLQALGFVKTAIADSELWQNKSMKMT